MEDAEPCDSDEEIPIGASPYLPAALGTVDKSTVPGTKGIVGIAPSSTRPADRASTLSGMASDWDDSDSVTIAENEEGYLFVFRTAESFLLSLSGLADMLVRIVKK